MSATPLTLLICSALLCLDAVCGTLLSQKGLGEPYTIGTFGGHVSQAVKVIRVTNTVAVPVPVPVPFPKHIPYPVSVPKPIPYAVPQPIPVEVTKPVVIRQPLPVEVPKPYIVPQPYSLNTFQSHDFGVSMPSEHLVAPAFHANQANDYQAYMTYGQDQGYTGNQEDVHSDYDYGMSSQGHGGVTQHQEFSNSYNAPAPGLYMVYDTSSYNSANSKVSIGHNFESTNSLDDQGSSGH